MDIEHLNIIRSYIEQALSGYSKENPKFDFKRDWYDLKSKKGINEFLKDTTAIANTFGPEGFLVIGFDDKAKKFRDTSFSMSGLKDPNELNGLINKRVDRLFDINIEDIDYEGHSLSVINVPPSIDKPHVIKNYQTFEKDGSLKTSEEHVIFVRKNTSSLKASKYDLELMYYDRKNIIPEYRINLYCYEKNSGFIKDSISFRFEGLITIENTGSRTISIVEFEFIYPLSTGIDPPFENLSFTTKDKLKHQNLIIKSGEIYNSKIRFYCHSEHISKDDIGELNSRKKEYFERSPIRVHLYNGKIIETKIKYY
jgi:hypothetical protein